MVYSLEFREEDVDEAGDGVVVDILFFDPDVAGGQFRTGVGLPEIEIGCEDAMGEHMFHPLRHQPPFSPYPVFITKVLSRTS